MYVCVCVCSLCNVEEKTEANTIASSTSARDKVHRCLACPRIPVCIICTGNGFSNMEH